MPSQVASRDYRCGFFCIRHNADLLIQGSFSGVQYIPKRHLIPQDVPKPPAGTLRSKHLPPSSVGLSPGSSRSTSLKNVGSMGSLPGVPSLESQASPPYPHCGRHPLHRYNLVCTRLPQAEMRMCGEKIAGHL